MEEMLLKLETLIAEIDKNKKEINQYKEKLSQNKDYIETMKSTVIQLEEDKYRYKTALREIANLRTENRTPGDYKVIAKDALQDEYLPDWID